MKKLFKQIKIFLTTILAIAVLAGGGYWYLNNVKPYRDTAREFLETRAECTQQVGSPVTITIRDVNITSGGPSRYNSSWSSPRAWVECDVSGPKGMVYAEVSMTTISDGKPKVLKAKIERLNSSGEIECIP